MTPSPLRRIVWDELRGARGAISVAVVSTLAVALTDLARPWPLKIIFDQVLLDRPAAPWLTAVFDALGGKTPLVIVLVAAATGAAAYLQVHITSKLGHLVVYRVRRELFAHLQRLSLSVHHRSRSGELLTRLSSDAQSLKDTFTESAITLGAHAVTIVGCFAIMFSLSVQLSLIVAATMPLLGWSLFRLFRAARAAAKTHRAHEEHLTTHITRALTTAPLIQAFGRERHEAEQFVERSKAHLTHGVAHARFEAVSARSVELIGAGATALIVLFGSLEVLAGRMTPGTVLVFSTYLHSLYRPIRQIAKLSTRLSTAAVSARRIDEVLQIAPEVEDAPSAIEARHIRGGLEFDQVSFGYAGGPLVLRDVSFRFAAGQRVVIVGASGAGKSTLVSLLLRLYDPVQGTIRLDGVDIRDYRRESLRRSIAIVLQESLLFGASVRENTAYGKLDATDAEVEAAARAANAHTFVERLERGYDTIIGERGATLSGGQRQRLAIARAIIRDAPILLLDEPMTGLDRRAQARVQAAIDRAARGRTCLVITHDVHAAATADLILVLRDGRLVEAGRHADLVARAGEYSALLHLYPVPQRALEAVGAHG